jgi:hypothetical protein
MYDVVVASHGQERRVVLVLLHAILEADPDRCGKVHSRIPCDIQTQHMHL